MAKQDPSPHLDPQVFDLLFSELVTMFPDHDLSLLHRILTSHGELEVSIDAVLAHDIAALNVSEPSSPTRPKRASKGRGLRTDHSHLAQQLFKGPPTPSPDSGRPSSCPPSSVHRPISSEGFSLAYCENMVKHYTEKRNAAFTSAAKAFGRRGQLASHSGTAFYYSVEGRRFDEQLKLWQVRAARAIVEAQRPTAGAIYTLDLHNVQVKPALVIVEEDIQKWYLQESFRYSMSPDNPKGRSLKIITGLGIHSPDGQPKLQPAITKYLRANDWSFTQAVGCIHVRFTPR
ncbi:hypothetical protein H4R33_001058 [Dimargaris cristalligena]|nr:hypothetical protein H4R33_001058 [Dimargaris cristalligena]